MGDTPIEKYDDPTWDHGKIHYKCALLEFLIFVT